MVENTDSTQTNIQIYKYKIVEAVLIEKDITNCLPEKIIHIKSGCKTRRLNNFLFRTIRHPGEVFEERPLENTTISTQDLMSNFFRDTSLGFKQQRSNIFSKLKPKSNGASSTSTPSKSSLDHNIGGKKFGGRDDDDGDGDDDDSANVSANSPSSLMLMDYMYRNNADSERDLSSNHTSLNDSMTHTKDVLPLKKNRTRNQNLDELLDDDDVDFEITGVRDLEDIPKDQNLVSSGVTTGRTHPRVVQNNAEQTGHIASEIESLVTDVHRTKTKNTGEERTTIAISSNDVLLEAFTNTQKICAALKRDLHAEQSKNTKLTTDLRTCKFDMRKINDKVQEYKDQLQKLQEKINDFTKKSQDDASTIRGLKESQQKFEERMGTYMSEFTSVKEQLASFQRIKVELESELKRKVTELDYMKRELDDYSGQVSEEKIRNSALIHEISENRSEMKALLETLSDRYCKLNQENIVELKGYAKESIKSELIEQLTAQNDSFKSISDGLANHLITTISSNVSMLLKEQTTTSIETVLPRIEELIDASLTKLELQAFFSKSFSEVKDAISDNFRSNFDFLGNRIEVSIGATSKSVQDFIERLNGYQDKIMNAEAFKDRLHEMEKQLVSLEQLKLEHITIIGTKEAQYEELDNKLQKNLIELSNYKSTEKKLTDENVQLKSELTNLKDECLKLKGLMEIDQANAENKIASLKELNSSMSSEISDYKRRISELEETKMRCEEDQRAGLNRLQKANEQVQKLNVELVQAKAHGLELDEQNRNLMRCFNDKKCNTEEISNELRSLKQEMIVLESEKRDIVTEKLELLDRLEELKEGSKNMRLQITKLEEELRICKLKREDDDKQKAVTCHVLKEGSLGPRQVHDRQKSKRRRSRESDNGEIMSTLSRGKSTKVRIASSQCEKPMKVSTPRKTKIARHIDEFDLSDDLELTNPSPIALGHKNRTLPKRDDTLMKAPGVARKKLLIPDESGAKKTGVQRKPNKKRKC